MPEIDDLPLDELFRRLAEICERLETDKTLTLEQSVEIYESGARMQERIKTLLRDAELRVEQIRENGVVEKFDHERKLAKKQRR